MDRLDLSVQADGKLIQHIVVEAYRGSSKKIPADFTYEAIDPPIDPVDPEGFDPFNNVKCGRILDGLRTCLAQLPEVTEKDQFGSPAFKCGKKTFVTAFIRERRVHIEFWVGVDRQPGMLNDPKCYYPKYTGHNGWIYMDIHDRVDDPQLEQLIYQSY